MNRIAMLCLFATLGSVPTFSQTVSISGRVTDPQGNPLANTLVRLGQTRFDNSYGMSPYYTVTDSNGIYRLGLGGPQIGVITGGAQPGSSASRTPVLASGAVLFGIVHGIQPVTVTLHTLTGRLAGELLNTRLGKGSYTVHLDTKGMASQFCLVRITIDGMAWTFRVNTASSTAAVRGTAQPRSPGRLQKMAAVVDTLYATEPGYTPGTQPIEALSGRFDFILTKNHTWKGDTAAFWDTTTIRKEPGKLWYTILNRTNGQYPDSMIYWAIGDFGAPVRLSDSAHIDFSRSASGRLYIMVGYKPPHPGNMRPRDQTWDFEEHTNGPDSRGSIWYHGNTTRVDAYGLPLSFRLRCANFDTVRGEQYHVFFQSRQSLFDEFLNEVPREFSDLAVINAPYRIPNPAHGQIGTNGLYADYWDKYTRAFGINARAYLDGIPEPKISAGCHRHVMGLSDAEQADDRNYYRQAPCNFYSYFFHRRAIDSKCYGFPYDDYANWSSYVQHNDARWVAIAVGY